MQKMLDRVVQNDQDQIIGFVYATGSTFEAWQRERLPSATPGNKHTYVGVFATADGAIAELQAG